MHVKMVVLHRSHGDISFQVGEIIYRAGKKTDVTTQSIRVGWFQRVTVRLSDGQRIEYRGFPISFER